LIAEFSIFYLIHSGFRAGQTNFTPDNLIHRRGLEPRAKEDPMRIGNTTHFFVLSFCLLCALSVSGLAQSNGALRGAVTIGDTGKPAHNVLVTIIQLRRSVETDEKGAYEFQNVPAGRYDITAHLDLAPDVVKTVQITAGNVTTADFRIELSAVREQVTITATGREETTFNSIQSVTVVGSQELAKKNPVSLGEALDFELGVAKRSFGPGTSRPVVRGFDGDRVLVLQDGQRIGALGFQSGDHAEALDLLSLDRVEVVKGPATLLYGSSAIGGVVNAVSAHESAHEGLRGYITGIGATNNYQGGGSAGIEYGKGNWLVWGNGGGQRAGDYNTPLGRVTNSFTRDGNGSGGFGYFGKGWFSSDFSYDNRKYGIPFDASEVEPETVFLTPRRASLEVKGGYRDLDSFASSGQFSFAYNDYKHNEVEAGTGEIGTAFRNDTYLYRGVFDERRTKRLSGSFGFWGMHRDYESIGAESLTPPTTQSAFALFGLQSINLERAALQFGGRFEHNGYNPAGLDERSFKGFSGAAGLRVPIGGGAAFVANYTHSHRAPALEELYNNGPHPGNVAFEIGNPDLERESSDGIDLGLRHSSRRARAEANFFYYHINNFIFLAPTGEIEDGLPVANYAQGDSRFIGTEARLDVGLTGALWLLSSIDYVNAELKETETPLPRIPPLRARVGFEIFHKGFRFNPELVMARDQDRLFTLETRTAGYAAVNVTASYTIARQHWAQTISVNAFNLNDRLYFNHLSFIKGFAPEIGRGVRLVYTIRFF
jgi:iron complex outermembrane receptor protein